MAEARTENEEESLREARGGGGGGGGGRSHRPSSERAERNKPEQRNSSSQGALSSIRAVIKRTSNRTVAQTDPSRAGRRPEITILSAEPLATNNWFPGASGAFPPPPPPPAQSSWASGGLTVQLPPPSYEQVIREKNREQSVHSSVSSSSSSPTPRRSTVTIATQTDTDSSSPENLCGPPARRPPKPPRPSLPLAPKSEFGVSLTESDLPCITHTPDSSRGSDLLNTPLSEQCAVQTDFSNFSNGLVPLEATPPCTDSSHITNDPPLQHSIKREVSANPRPRPRSKAIFPPVAREEVLDRPMTREVKVQTLVRLKDDGSESVFAGFTDGSSDISSNKYLQELLDVFGYDEQDFQDDQPSESDQSEKSEDEEDKVAFQSCVTSSVSLEPLEPLKRPEPKPRTRNLKPPLAPKPSEPTPKAQETSPEEKITETLNPPVPAPRPLLTTKSSEGSKPEMNRIPRPPKPSVAARRSVLSSQAEETPSKHQTAAVSPNPTVDDQNVDDQHCNSSAAPVETAPVTLDNKSRGKCPLSQTQLPAKPLSQRRPPPPSSTNAQVDSKAPTSSVPSLPPRPSEGRLLPLRPPPIKLSKSAGSSHTPATSQLPAHRVQKRGPPLPPRPKPGHPLYKDYTGKVPQGNAEKSRPGAAPEEQCLQKEELLLAVDDTPTPTRAASFPGEVTGQVQSVCGGDVCTAARDEPVSQQKQNQEVKREQQKEQQTQPNTEIKCVARFAFEGQEEELTFCEGDIITVMECVNEEWGRGSLNGLTGLFPLSFVQDVPQRKATLESPAPPVCEGEKQTGRALFDFIPESEDELCLKVGDIVCSLEEVDEEWFLGESGGKRGIVPRNYIQVL